MYANGRGVPQDGAEAVRWRRLAAEQGHADAQFNLGFSFAIGRGVLKNAVIAYMWLTVADANGGANAREARDLLGRDMTRAEISRAPELARTCLISNYQDCGAP